MSEKKPTVRPWKEILFSVKDQLPGKEPRSDSEPPHGPRPWAEIVNGAASQSAPPLLRMPMPSFFLGAGLLSGGKYLFWRCKRLLEVHDYMHKDGPRSYRDWVLFARNLVNDEENNFAAEGYTLMYQVLIEPLALMDLGAQAGAKPEAGETAERRQQRAG